MKETIIQFGTGVFLRGFFADFIQTLNEKELYDGKIVVVQPTKSGRGQLLNECGGEYNLLLRGRLHGEDVFSLRKINSISRCVDPYKNYEDYLALAKNPSLRFIVSNTTEAGIAFDNKCSFHDRPALSFPGKLTQLLYQRYLENLPGFIILCCELIAENGTMLEKCVKKYATMWELGDDFLSWLDDENTFTNTLVDRIVSGYPEDAEEIFEKIGKEDKLLNVAEPYHLWVIEGDFEEELPLEKGGINVIRTDDVVPYSAMKTRVLNGAHTSLVFASLLCEIETVKQSLDDEQLSQFLNRCLFDCILPAFGEDEQATKFAGDVLERFSNPYLNHRWQAISLNSLSKFRQRVLPSIADYLVKKGELPKPLVFSLSCLIYYYKHNTVNDNSPLAPFVAVADLGTILSDKSIWGLDLSQMKNLVEKGINLIEKEGIRKALDWAISR